MVLTEEDEGPRIGERDLDLRFLPRLDVFVDGLIGQTEVVFGVSFVLELDGDRLPCRSGQQGWLEVEVVEFEVELALP